MLNEPVEVTLKVTGVLENLGIPYFRLPPSPNSTFPSRIWGGSGWQMPRKKRSNPNTKHKAINLRKDPTPAERKLWSRIRNDQLGVTFRRQHAVGNYIPDFCSPKAKLIIELDGSQHLDQEEYDEERTKQLESLGYKVIRFWNNDVVKDIDSVIRAIILAMESESYS
jgi:very-short-patch-repair endonuclease